MAERIGRLSYWLSRIVHVFACAGLLTMAGIVVWQVFARYVLNDSPAWAEPAALLLMIWYVMFAAAAGVREGFHIRIAVFADALSPRWRRLAVVTAHLVVAAFGLAMLIWSRELVTATWTHVIPTLAFPRGVAYLPMIISGLLVFAFSLEHVVAELRRTEVPPAWS